MDVSDNPDRIMIRDFLSGGQVPTQVVSNPLAIALGAELLSYDAAEPRLEMRFRPERQFFQGNQVVQGGALSSMLDFLMAFCSLATVDDQQTVTTMNMSTSFLAAARTDVFDGWGTIDKRGRSAIFARAGLSANGKLVAMATSTLMIIGERR